LVANEQEAPAYVMVRMASDVTTSIACWFWNVCGVPILMWAVCEAGRTEIWHRERRGGKAKTVRKWFADHIRQPTNFRDEQTHGERSSYVDMVWESR